MRALDRKVRLGQTITPFGVGAIYDVLGESFVSCETGYWKGHGTPLKAQRLADKLPDVRGFRSAPSTASFFASAIDYGVPYFRFPQWMFCGSCRRMIRWKYTMEEEGRSAICGNCKGEKKLVPMRFVAICEKGHLSDVPGPPGPTPGRRSTRSSSAQAHRWSSSPTGAAAAAWPPSE